MTQATDDELCVSKLENNKEIIEDDRDDSDDESLIKEELEKNKFSDFTFMND